LAAERPEVHAALLTPLAADGGVDTEALAAHVRWLVSAGIDGVLVAGTTGEGPLLDDDDVVRAVEAAAGKTRVIAHVGRPSTTATARLAARTLEAGADEVSAVVPYYYGLDDEQLFAHYAALVEAVAPARLLVYVIPARTVNDVSAELLDRLARVGVAGLKDSTKSLDRHAEYLDVGARHQGFRVYMGSDGLAVDALERGASGLISAVANVWPELVVALRDAVVAGELARAREREGGLLAIRAQTNGLVGLKQLVAERIENYPVAARSPLG
jgi:4-hydroxy-tetrahydrodipicolinate synthase/2-dehydro-3-deoxy-phosphogluconate/2-dehydro-3-deoxy-6-phosphogalactonate aldolase